ncbi:hypothetical protein ABH945_000668 [Paraburkholderia sp. GAS333]
MKRFVVGLAGIGYGLVVTWACLVTLSRFDWFRNSHRIMQGCHELGKCALPWYNWPILYVVIFGPATVAAAINLYAWRRWTFKRWGYYTGSAMFLCAALYFVAVIILER